MLRTHVLVILALGVVLAVAPAPGSGATTAPRAPSVSAVERPRWVWPIDSPHPILRQFIAPATRYSAGHRGIDLGSLGPNVYSPAAGVVSFSGVVVDRPVLSITHAGGLVSSFEPVETALVAGDEVSAGEVIGTLLPGHCDSLCLHFGVRLNGEYVSPMKYLGGIRLSVLLPTRWPAPP